MSPLGNASYAAQDILAHAQNSLAQYDTFSLDEYEQLAKKLCVFQGSDKSGGRAQQHKAARAQAAKLMAAIREVLAPVKQ